MKVLLVLSGGLDSAVTLYNLIQREFDVEAITFDYNQRHKKEIQSAKALAKKVGIKHDIIPVPAEFKSALTSDIKVPYGHYQEESMKLTVVPNRNMIFLSIAAGIAISREIDNIAIGVHAGDHDIYPDCRPDTIRAIERAIQIGNWHCQNFMIFTPYIYQTKEDIVKDGIKYQVPFDLTWTCYEGKEKPCGKCGSCIERLEAFERNNITDPLDYE